MSICAVRKYATRLILPFVVLLAACDTKTPEQPRVLALPPTDSVPRTDSLVAIKNELLNEVLASTQFVNDLNNAIAKLKSRRPPKLTAAVTRESDLSLVKEQRASIVARIRELVARLDSSEANLVSLRTRAAAFAERDSTIVSQVAAYKKTIADLRRSVERAAVYEYKMNEPVDDSSTSIAPRGARRSWLPGRSASEGGRSRSAC